MWSAVAQVEAMGRTGFLPDKRPLILFEAHWFSKLMGARYDRAHPNLSSPSWDKSLYRGGAREYDRLHAAIALDRSAALKSASWGMFQIMGFNYALVGYKSVAEYVLAMCNSAGAHLRAFVRFVQAKGLQPVLRRHNFARFAYRYNGDGYRQNAYDEQMLLAYKRFTSDTTYLMGVAQTPQSTP
jgi:hypothetical protein